MVHILFRAGKKSRVRFYFPPPLFFSLHPYYFLLLPRRQNPILLHRKKSLLRSPPPLLLHRCCYKRKGPLEKSPLSPAISSTVAALLQSPPLLLFSCNLTINQTLHYDGDVKELCLDFTVTEESVGKRHIIELKPGGKDVYVTNENKLQYVHTMADYKLNRQILPLSNAFYRGLTDLIAPSWLKLFNASEFNQLLSGGKHDIDVDDLRSNTRYTGGYTEGSRTVKIFWEVIREFEPNERCMLLKFVTSCSRAPLLGFKYLQPTFTIHKVACDVPLWATFGGQDVDRLPSASTCYNTLKLPTYRRSSTMRAKLLYAINSNAGFELS